MPPTPSNPLVGIIMGSPSDHHVLRGATEVLDELQIPYEEKIVSAHRTPDRLYEYATTAQQRGLKLIIAIAGGAAHLPGMTAALTQLPVLGVPVVSSVSNHGLSGLDSLLSIVQMPKGVPVGCLAVGNAGATNACLLAAAILALQNSQLAERLANWRQKQTDSVPYFPSPAPRESQS